jgi:hypothetical protein
LADETSFGREHKEIEKELMKMDNSIQQFSDGERLGALTQIYLELSLPPQVALRAAEADLCYFNAQKSDSHWKCLAG